MVGLSLSCNLSEDDCVLQEEIICFSLNGRISEVKAYIQIFLSVWVCAVLEFLSMHSDGPSRMDTPCVLLCWPQWPGHLHGW